MDDPSFDLSPLTGSNTITLLLRDPDWAWTFWEINDLGVNRACVALGEFATDVSLALRLYITDKGRRNARASCREYPVTRWLDSRLLFLGPPGKRHQAAIGCRGRNNTFAPICRSNWLESPTTTLQQTAPRFVQVRKGEGDLEPLVTEIVGRPQFDSISDAEFRPKHRGVPFARETRLATELPKRGAS